MLTLRESGVDRARTPVGVDFERPGAGGGRAYVRAHLEPELARLKADSVALVTTRSLLPAVEALPIKAMATVVIAQHAPMSQIDAGVEECAGARGIVSYGGGSAIDAAKIISVRLAGGGSPPPHVAIPTTLSVAELAAGAGYTNEAGDKAGMRDPRLMVESVIYDADLTLATPMQLWLSTGVRALDHAVEGFLAPGEHPSREVRGVEAPLAKPVGRDVATIAGSRRADDPEVHGEVPPDRLELARIASNQG